MRAVRVPHSHRADQEALLEAQNRRSKLLAERSGNKFLQTGTFLSKLVPERDLLKTPQRDTRLLPTLHTKPPLDYPSEFPAPVPPLGANKTNSHRFQAAAPLSTKAAISPVTSLGSGLWEAGSPKVLSPCDPIAAAAGLTTTVVVQPPAAPAHSTKVAQSPAAMPTPVSPILTPQPPQAQKAVPSPAAPPADPPHALQPAAPRLQRWIVPPAAPEYEAYRTPFGSTAYHYYDPRIEEAVHSPKPPCSPKGLAPPTQSLYPAPRALTTEELHATFATNQPPWGQGSLFCPMDADTALDMDDQLGAEYETSIIQSYHMDSQFKRREVMEARRTARAQQRERLERQKRANMAFVPAKKIDKGIMTYPDRPLSPGLYLESLGSSNAASLLGITNACAESARQFLEQKDEAKWNLEREVEMQTKGRLKGHESYAEARAVFEAKVAKMHAPLTEEEQRALDERMAKDRWDRMSEMQRIMDLEKQAQEEQEKKDTRAQLARDLQRKGKGKGALKMQQAFLEEQEQYSEQLQDLLQIVKESIIHDGELDEEDEVPMQERMRCMQKAEVLMAQMELRAVEAEQQIIDDARAEAKRKRDEAVKQALREKEEQLRLWWKEQREQLQRDRLIMEQVNQECKLQPPRSPMSISTSPRKSAMVNDGPPEPESPLRLTDGRPKFSAYQGELVEMDESKQWIQNWKYETHRHHEMVLRLQLAWRCWLARRRVECRRRARILINARMLREDEARRLKYEEEQRRKEEERLNAPVDRMALAIQGIICFQAQLRGWLARELYQEKRRAVLKQRQDAEQHHCAIRIQALARGYLIRNRIYITQHPEIIEKNRIKRHTRYASLLQAMVRTFNVRCHMRVQRTAVCKMQKVVRGWLGREYVRRHRRWLIRYRDFERCDFAARVISRNGLAYARRVAAQRRMAEQKAAALKLQKWYRSILKGRVEGRLRMIQNGAWTHEMEVDWQEYIRSRTHPYEVPPRCEREKTAAEVLQRSVRRRQAKIYTKHLRRFPPVAENHVAATKVQLAFKSYAARREAQRRRNRLSGYTVREYAARVVQHFFKCLVATKKTDRRRKVYRDQNRRAMSNDAATAIQASYRGFRTRRSFVADREAFTEHIAAHAPRPDVQFDRSLREQLEYKMNALDYEADRYTAAVLLQNHLTSLLNAKKEVRAQKARKAQLQAVRENPAAMRAIVCVQQFCRACNAVADVTHRRKHLSPSCTAELKAPMATSPAAKVDPRPASATKLQAVWRGHMARRESKNKAWQDMEDLQAEEREFLNAQAQKIQTFFRLVCQHRSEERRQATQPPEATTSTLSGSVERRDSGPATSQQQPQPSATGTPANRAKRVRGPLPEDHLERADTAALRIQAFGRTVLARRKVQDRQKAVETQTAETSRDDAAFIIQQFWRKSHVKGLAQGLDN